ncbi:hypothetical protein N8016_02705 [Pelagibacteraceae bacterium]|nr:hypothetical protein [Pelagibacteraceae bacterium]
MKKLLAIIVLGLLSFNITEAAKNNEGKNKKYVYKYLNDLKTIIKNEDPTDLKELKFIRKSENKEFFGRSGKPNRSDNSGKRKSYEYDAFVFHAIYNSEHKITFLVDTDFAKDFDKAKKYALIYAKSMGQMPLFLREGHTKYGEDYKDTNLGVGTGTERGVKIIVIAKGNKRWWANFKQAKFILYPQNKDALKDLVLMHESAHLSIHGKITTDVNWYPAVLADGKYITKYARTNRGEDVADTISFWVAVRCIEGFSQKKKDKILKAIPNRIKFLDDFVKDNKLNTSPMVCS